LSPPPLRVRTPQARRVLPPPAQGITAPVDPSLQHGWTLSARDFRFGNVKAPHLYERGAFKRMIPPNHHLHTTGAHFFPAILWRNEGYMVPDRRGRYCSFFCLHPASLDSNGPPSLLFGPAVRGLAPSPNFPFIRTTFSAKGRNVQGEGRRFDEFPLSVP